MAFPIPHNPDALLRREDTAEALTASGYPTKAKTLATKATRGGGPPYRKYGPWPLYRWGDSLAWAESRLSEPRCNSSDVNAPSPNVEKRPSLTKIRGCDDNRSAHPPTLRSEAGFYLASPLWASPNGSHSSLIGTPPERRLTHQQKPGGTIPWRDQRAHRAKHRTSKNEEGSNSSTASQSLPQPRAPARLVRVEADATEERKSRCLAHRKALWSEPRPCEHRRSPGRHRRIPP
jgi:hypothetical protein